MPDFQHVGYAFTIDDDWWLASGMIDFVPAALAYPPGNPEDTPGIRSLSGESRIIIVPLAEIEPVRRNLSHGVFNDDGERTARDRVTRLLDGFRRGNAIPPVEILPSESKGFRYRLNHGVHRFYCSIAAGFTHIPAIDVS